jgi:hypothetical protein
MERLQIEFLDLQHPIVSFREWFVLGSGQQEDFKLFIWGVPCNSTKEFTQEGFTQKEFTIVMS